MDETLDGIFKDDSDIIRHVWELIGYCIQPRKDIATWWLFYGRGANGKTLLLKIISSLINEAVLERPVSDFDTGRNPHAFADLPGKLLVIDEDVKAKTLLPDDFLKKISENKPLNCNPKFQVPFRFKSAATIIMAANSFPQTRDLTEGMRRRANIIPFTRRFADFEMDRSLDKKIIDNELSGVLNRALAGLKRLRKRNNFLIPGPCKLATKTWIFESSPVTQFLEMYYRQVPIMNKQFKTQNKVKFKEFWDNYIIWCVENGIDRRFTKSGLRRSIEELGFIIDRSNRGNNFIFGLRRKRVKSGIDDFKEDEIF